MTYDKPRILLVDDERDFRTEVLTDSEGDQLFDVDVAQSSAEAIGLLDYSGETGQFYDQIWLDRHLGGNDTSIPVAKHLVQYYASVLDALNSVSGPILVYIHSQNPIGVGNLLGILKDADCYVALNVAPKMGTVLQRSNRVKSKWTEAP